MIYADNAATTAMSRAAYQAMRPYFEQEYGNPSTLYGMGQRAHRAIEDARKTIAACIGADPSEVYFTSGGTEADNWAIKEIMFACSDRRALLTTQIEHHAVLNSAAAIGRMGYPVTYLPVDTQGILQPNTLREAISAKIKLVSVMMANNEIGTIEPIRELVGIAHEAGALLHTDAVQAVGHILVDVHALGVDLLSASAHKFNGPKGVGFLYCKAGTALPPLLCGGGQEFGLRSGTENVAGIVGMAVALKENITALSENMGKLDDMAQTLREKLRREIPDVVFNGDPNHRLSGAISVSFRKVSAESMLHYLDLHGICVSSGSACNSKSTEVSHVLQAIHLPDEYARGTIRITLGVSNTQEDIIAIAAHFRKAYDKLAQ